MQVQLEAFSVGADFFYKLIDETAWISSRVRIHKSLLYYDHSIVFSPFLSVQLSENVLILYVNCQHLEMATFLIRKRQLSHPLLFGTDWTTADYALQVHFLPCYIHCFICFPSSLCHMVSFQCLQQFLEPLKATGKTRGSKKAAASNTSDLPANKLKNVHHFVHGTWQHGYAQAWKKVRRVYFPYNLRESHWVAIEIDFVRHTATVYDSYVDYTKSSKLVTLLQPVSDTLARVLYNMKFYEDSEVEEVKQKGLQMSRFTPFSVCIIGGVPQQRDG